jgi:hypothetical protein
MLGLVGGFVVLAMLLYLSVRGVGPFEGRVLGSVPRGTGEVTVTVEITNEGRKAGRAKCVVARVDTATGERRPEFQFLSDRVAGHSTVTQQVVVPVDSGVTTGTVSC